MKVHTLFAHTFLAATFLSIGVRAHAQTETPTATPTSSASPTVVCTPLAAAPPCAGNNRVRINWTSKKPYQINVSVSSTKCGAPASCSAAPRSGVQTLAPISFTVRDGSCQTLSTMFTSPGVNYSGCPGGKDSYKATNGKLKIIYGVGTTVLGFMTIPFGQPPAQPTLQPTPATPLPTATPIAPSFVGPLQFNITDAAGYSVGGTLSTCLTTQTATTWRLKCF